MDCFGRPGHEARREREPEACPSHGDVLDKKEAVDREAELRTEIKNDTFVKPSTVTVGEWLDEWLETKVNLQSTTRAGYERDIRRIKKALGHRKLRDLSPTAINRFYVDLGRTLSAKSIQNCHGVLYSSLQAAVDRDVILRNPAARGIELPKVERTEVEVWTKDELRAFLQHASGHCWYPAIALAIGSGMRRSEVLGLRWVNCDLDARIVRVRDTLVPVNGGMEHRINVTKSKKSRRDIPLDEATVAVLKAHRKRQAEERMASPDWDGRGYVFTDPVGRPIRPTSFSRAWKQLAVAAGIRPLTPHPAARHGWATLALESGIPMRVVQEQLGHATLDITANLYSHVTEDLARDAVETVSAAVWLQS